MWKKSPQDQVVVHWGCGIISWSERGDRFGFCMIKPQKAQLTKTSYPPHPFFFFTVKRPVCKWGLCRDSVQWNFLSLCRLRISVENVRLSSEPWVKLLFQWKVELIISLQGVFWSFLLEWMCDVYLAPQNIPRAVYWHLAIKLYCILYWGTGNGGDREEEGMGGIWWNTGKPFHQVPVVFMFSGAFSF